jgi:hypothetical protein
MRSYFIDCEEFENGEGLKSGAEKDGGEQEVETNEVATSETSCK